MVNWNANGLRQKELELLEFVREHQADVVLISETHLKPPIVTRVSGYTIYRSDRKSALEETPLCL